MHLLRAAVCLGASVAAVQGTRIDHRGPREASSASLPEDDNTRSTFHSRRAVGAVSSLSPGLRKRSPTRPTSPHFNRDYWETWWEEHPDKLPDKGPDIQACFNNLKDYVWTPSLQRTLGYLQIVPPQMSLTLADPTGEVQRAFRWPT